MTFLFVIKRVGLFSAHFFLTKELIFKFYEDWNFFNLLTVSIDDVVKYKTKVLILSLICCFLFVMLNYAFRNLKVYWKVLSFFVAILASLILVNFFYSLESNELYIRNSYNNFVIVGIVFSIFHFMLNFLMEKFTNRTPA